MKYNTQQTRRRFPSLTPHESKKLTCVGVVLAKTYRPPQILLRTCLLISVLVFVLHNSFIFSLVFVMCFFVFHLHILMIFVLCFTGVAEAGFVCYCVEISRFAKFHAAAKFPLALFIFLPLRLLQPFISCAIH